MTRRKCQEEGKEKIKWWRKAWKKQARESLLKINICPLPQAILVARNLKGTHVNNKKRVGQDHQIWFQQSVRSLHVLILWEGQHKSAKIEADIPILTVSLIKIPRRKWVKAHKEIRQGFQIWGIKIMISFLRVDITILLLMIILHKGIKLAKIGTWAPMKLNKVWNQDQGPEEQVRRKNKNLIWCKVRNSLWYVILRWQIKKWNPAMK